MTDPRLVFLLDVDNTLLDNDRVKSDIQAALPGLIGDGRASRFWELYESVRDERGFVDYPLTAKRLGEDCHDPGLEQKVMDFLYSVRFMDYLYPHALECIQYLNTIGLPVIVSDGDQVYQVFKIKSSGLYDAVDGRVLITVHKEEELKHIFATWEADQYVAVDDKARIIEALEKCCPKTVTTVLVMQGHYASLDNLTREPDFILQKIGDLRTITKQQFLDPHAAEPAGTTA